MDEKEAKEKLYDLFKYAINCGIAENEELLLDKYPEDYDRHDDCDYLDGRCMRCDDVYDEEKLHEDAIDRVIDDIKYGCSDIYDRIVDSDNLIEILSNIARGL